LVDPEIMTPFSGNSAEAAHYKLYGVLYHHGRSAGGGHYTVDVLHQSEDSGVVESWMHVDDEVVNAVQHEDVFGGRDNERRRSLCLYAVLLSHCSYSDMIACLPSLGDVLLLLFLL
jgi:ubiquitin carboxyl-terminal hydrolase 10